MYRQGLKQVRKIKVLGYPFAAPSKKGTAMTPQWLKNEQWFNSLACSSTKASIEFEDIKMIVPQDELMANDCTIDYDTQSEEFSSSEDEINLMHNYKAAVIQNAQSLRQQTHQALKDGYYPIVIGGDNTQAIGSISGMKKYMPEAKLIWIDSRNDDQSIQPLTYIYGGAVRDGQSVLHCIDPEEIAFIGDVNADISLKHELVIGQRRCKTQNMSDISTLMSRYFRKQAGQDPTKYWISLDASSLSSQDFKSTSQSQENGLHLDFIMSFYQEFIPKSIGMDLSEVNFQMTSGVAQHYDQQTLRELLEHIVHQVNQPAPIDMDQIFETTDMTQKL